MKTKILKRIIAALVAFSAVIGTSGFASAVKRGPSKNNQSQSSIESGDYDGTSSEGEEEEEGYSMVESFSDDEELDYEEKNYEYQPYFENILEEEDKVGGDKKSSKNKAKPISLKAQIYKIEDLLKKPIKSAADRKNFVDVVLRMSKVKLIKNSIQPYLSQIMIRLNQCSNDDEVRANVAGILKNFAQKGLFIGCYKESVNGLIGILNQCAKTVKARINVAGALKNFAQTGLLFNGFNQENVDILIDILNQCAQIDKARINVAGAFKNFAQKGLFNGFDKDSVNKLIGILNKCAQTDKARINVAVALKNFAQKGLFNGFDKDSVNGLIGILDKCAQTDEARINVTVALKKFAQKGLFNGFDKDSVNGLIGVLNKCMQIDKARANVLEILEIFGVHGIFEGFEKEQIDALLNILIQCEQNDKARANVAVVFGEFIQNDFLRKCTTQQVSAISASLIECSKYENAKDNVSYTLRIFANKLVEYLRDENARPKIREMAEDLIIQLMQCVNDDVFKWKISYIISIFSSNGLINGLSEDKILKIVNCLEACAGDSESKESVASSIIALVSNHALDSFKGQPDKLLALVKILEECYKSDDVNTQRKVRQIIDNFFFEKFSTLDDGKLKYELVALCQEKKEGNGGKILDLLIQDSLFKDLTEAGKERLKKLLGY